MKIGIIGDAHLGVKRYSRVDKNGNNVFSKINDKLFDECLSILTSNNVDIIIQSGDLFDRPDPSIMNLIYFNNEITKYSIGEKFYTILGNHDTNEFLTINNSNSFELLNNVHAYYDKAHKVDFQDNVSVYFLPYGSLNPITWKFINSTVDNSRYNICVIHGSVDYSNDYNDNEYNLPVEIAKKFNTVICGHVHLPYITTTDGGLNVITPGSIILSDKATQNDTFKPATYILDTDNGEVSIYNLNSPKVIEYFLHDNEDLNALMSTIVSEGITDNIIVVNSVPNGYQIDQLLYNNIISSNIYFKLNYQSYDRGYLYEEVSDFWDYVRSNSDYYDNYKEVIKSNVNK